VTIRPQSLRDSAPFLGMSLAECRGAVPLEVARYSDDLPPQYGAVTLIITLHPHRRLAMRAMVYRGPYRIRIEEKEIPSIEHPNDAIVRVTRAAICGSDLHLYHGLIPDTRVGMTFGHEFTGVVHDIGPSVQNLQRGDCVLVPFNIACGSCFFCARELYGNCHNVNANASAVGGIYGYSHTAGGYDGGQAEYVRVPFADVGPSKIPDWMDEEDAVLLTDACPTGYFGAELGDIKGAGRVIVIDHLDYRLQMAQSFAHAETINFTHHDDIVMHLKKVTDFLGADVCIDAVGAEADGSFLQVLTSSKLKLQGGSPVALNWAIDSVRKAGTVSVVGAYGPVFSAVKFGDAMNKGLTIRTNQCSVKRHWPRLFEHVKNGVLKPSAIVTHRIPLEEIAEGYHMFSSKLDNCVKPLVIPQSH
jgi:threonine dehydrogenase-like Zn-dependent dehydrogenase